MTTNVSSEELASEDDYEDFDYVKMTLPIQIPTAIGLSILIVLAIAGNTMTVIAYVTDKTLRNIYDFYIFNLAITDLLISCVSMPFYAVYTLMEFVWPFGYAFCKVWIAADFTFCFESILLMLLLSLDRLLLLTMGLQYSLKMTKKVAIIQVASSWFISFLVYGPAIIGWNHWVGYSTVAENDCDVEFAFNFSFTAATSVLEFMLPFIILSSMNILIYFKIRRRKSVSVSIPVVTSVSKITQSEINVNGGRLSKPDINDSCELSSDQESIEQPVKDNTSKAGEYTSSTKKDQSKTTQSNGNHTRELKAARFLAILVIAFLVLWAPYTITTMAIAFCGEKCLNVSLYEFFNWVLWFKSAINPLLYALNSSSFRRHFIRYIRCNGRLKACR